MSEERWLWTLQRHTIHRNAIPHPSNVTDIHDEWSIATFDDERGAKFELIHKTKEQYAFRRGYHTAEHFKPIVDRCNLCGDPIPIEVVGFYAILNWEK